LRGRKLKPLVARRGMENHVHFVSGGDRKIPSFKGASWLLTSTLLSYHMGLSLQEASSFDFFFFYSELEFTFPCEFFHLKKVGLNF
jgi:hypothetical protein